MNRRKKTKLKLNDINSLEGLLQETYVDACNQISNAQNVIDVLITTTEPQDVDDITKIAKEKISAVKAKDSGIRIKIEIGKLMNEVIKHNGSVEDAIDSRVSQGSTSVEGYNDLRAWIKENATKNT